MTKLEEYRAFTPTKNHHGLPCVLEEFWEMWELREAALEEIMTERHIDRDAALEIIFTAKRQP